jgi:O-antigen/teichoic acid export membrane protein
VSGPVNEPGAGGERPERPGSPDSIARNTGFAVAVRLTSALFTAGLTLFLIRYLGPDDYGVFALAIGVGSVALLPSNLGISQASARYIAERRGSPDGVAAVVSDALVLKVVFGGLCAVALAALAGPIADAYGDADLEWPLRILAVGVFGQGMLLVYDAMFESLGRISVYLRVVIGESALETGASVALVLLGGGAAGAVAGRAGAYLAAAGLGLVLLARTVGAPIRARLTAGRGHRRRLLGYGSALLVIDGAFIMFAKIDVLLIGAILSVKSVGLFEAPLRLVAFLGLVGTATAAGVAPRVSRGGRGPNLEALQVALRWLVLLQGMIVAPLVVWGGPIADAILGSDYEESGDVLRAIAPYAFLLGLSPLLASAVNYLGEAKRRVPIAIGALLVNFVIDLALLSELGIIAGAIGTNVAYILYVSAHVWILRRLVGLRVRPLAPTLARAAVAMAAMSAVLLPFGTSDVGPATLVAGTLLGIAVYTGALMALGEISRSEARGALRSLRAAPARWRAAPGRG